LRSGIFSFGILLVWRRRFRCRRTLAQGILEVDGNAVLLQQVRKRLVGQFLKSRHAIARELPQFIERIVVEGDQFTHG